MWTSPKAGSVRVEVAYMIGLAKDKLGGVDAGVGEAGSRNRDRQASSVWAEERSARQLAVGQLRRQVHLGSEALYRVVAERAGFVAVEVIKAPGLTPGQRFDFARAAVQRMDVVSELAGIISASHAISPQRRCA